MNETTHLARPVRITLVGGLLFCVLLAILGQFSSGAWLLLAVIIALAPLLVIGYVIFQLCYWAWNGHFYTD